VGRHPWDEAGRAKRMATPELPGHTMGLVERLVAQATLEQRRRLVRVGWGRGRGGRRGRRPLTLGVGHEAVEDEGDERWSTPTPPVNGFGPAQSHTDGNIGDHHRHTRHKEGERRRAGGEEERQRGEKRTSCHKGANEMAGIFGGWEHELCLSTCL
jgi:hypothetical protein